jgi:hypothetical protein
LIDGSYSSRRLISSMMTFPRLAFSPAHANDAFAGLDALGEGLSLRNAAEQSGRPFSPHLARRLVVRSRLLKAIRKTR